MKTFKLKLRDLVRNRGFALLISVIISTIILTIGLSIINSAIKEVILASTIRHSIVALYAADSGIECGLYWDNIRGNSTKHSAFTPVVPPVFPIVPYTIECMGITKTYQVNPTPPPYKITLDLKDDTKPNNVCTQLIVETSDSPVPPVGGQKYQGPKTGVEHVLMQSWGYNNCNPASQRRVDRALEVKYSKTWSMP